MLAFQAFPQDNKSKIDILDNPKVVLAKQTMYGGKYKSAIHQFKTLYDKYPANSELPHHIGYCYYEIADYKNAMDYFSEAEKNGASIPETHLYLGLLYQKQSNFDKAIRRIQSIQIQSKIQKTNRRKRCGCIYLPMQQRHSNEEKSCTRQIINMGQDINSEYDDATPCVTADGKMLAFNTRRPEDPNSPIDVEGDGKYYQDIYVSYFDTVNKKWTAAHLFPAMSIPMPTMPSLPFLPMEKSSSFTKTIPETTKRLRRRYFHIQK
ncbi:MAG: hypothetical protein KatS3mg027_1004 [Bacteroidia bacterium]|nr:MAG: hypothetical protein KatS3mg027_1004 [Bacteroidia bacterium]